MTAASVFLGVDGGGSKTELVCIDSAGTVLSRAMVGATYHPPIGIDGVCARLREGVGTVLAPLGLGPEAIGFAFFGLPAFGEDTVADPLLVAACRTVMGHDRFACDNDMVCAWAGSLDLRDGINLVAGTGSIAYGECEGRKARAGGWGEVFGDEGSGYWIGMRGLQLFARMSDRRAPVGPLHQIFSDTLGLREDLEICEHITSRPDTMRERVAALSPAVVQAANAGDVAAAAILFEAGRELAELVMTLKDRLAFTVNEPVPLSWSGSIVSRVAPVRQSMVSFLPENVFEFVIASHAPAIGAALLAQNRFKDSSVP